MMRSSFLKFLTSEVTCTWSCRGCRKTSPRSSYFVRKRRLVAICREVVACRQHHGSHPRARRNHLCLRNYHPFERHRRQALAWFEFGSSSSLHNVSSRRLLITQVKSTHVDLLETVHYLTSRGLYLGEARIVSLFTLRGECSRVGCNAKGDCYSLRV